MDPDARGVLISIGARNLLELALFSKNGYFFENRILSAINMSKARSDNIDHLIGDAVYALEHLSLMRLDGHPIDAQTERNLRKMAAYAARIHNDLFPEVDFLYPPREKKRQEEEILTERQRRRESKGSKGD